MNAQLNKDRLKFEKEEAAKMPADVRKRVNSTFDEIEKNLGTVAKVNTLFGSHGIKFEGGLLAMGEKKLRQLLGAQDKADDLRTKIVQLVNTDAMEGLPKGAASDRDVRLVLEGFPPAGSSYEYYKKYFEAVKRVSDAKTKYLDVKNQWIKKNWHEANADKVFEINGEKGS